MANTIRLKRSALAGKAPATTDLALGEIAINTTDGKLYLKKSNGGEFIVEVGPVTSVAGRTGAVVLSRSDVDILGYEVKFARDQNSPEELRQGRFTVNFAAEEAPVLRYLGIQSARYRPALDALLDDLLAQVDAVTG